MPDLACFRRQPVEAAHRSEVDISRQVFGDRARIVAGEAFLRGVVDKMRMLGGWIIDSGRPARGRSEPQPSKMVYVEGSNESFRQAIGRSEAGKSPCRITRQATLIKTKPQIAGPVLGKRPCRFQGWQPICFGKSMKFFVGAMPLHEPDHALFGCSHADPQIASRIF